MSDDRSTIDKALDVLVYAPFGVLLYAREVGPTFLRMFVGKGRAELAQRHRQTGQQLDQYRKVGELALAFGPPEVRRRMEQSLESVRELTERTLTGFAESARANSAPAAPGVPPSPSVVPSVPSPSVVPPEPSAPVDRAPAAPAPEPSAGPPVESLPIPDYDELSASQVVERLDGLSTDELAAVRDYERAHRGRRTVLGKIEQLCA